MMRLLLIAVLAVLAGLSGEAARAQPPATRPAAASASDAGPAIAPQQAQQALEVLRDPARRDQFISVLETLSKAPAPVAAPAPAAAAPAPATAAPATAAPALVAPAVPAPAATPAPAPAAEKMQLPLAPDSLGAQILLDASRQISEMTDDAIATARTITDFPLLWGFAVHLVSDPFSRSMMEGAAWRLLVAMGVALAAQWAMRRLLTRPRGHLQHRWRRVRIARGHPAPEDIGLAAAEEGQTEKLRRRLPSPLLVLHLMPYLVIRLLVLLLPVVAFLAAGYATLAAGLGDDPIGRLVVLAALHAFAVCSAISCVVRVLVGPGEPRLFPLTPASAEYVWRWARRIVVVAVFGYTLAEIGLVFGLFRVAHDALLKLVVLVDHVLIAIVVLQNKAVVARWIHARPGATGFVAALRNRLAGVWHLVAIFYLVAVWGVWALHVPNGPSRLLRVGALTALVLIVARLLTVTCHRGLDRAAKIPPELAARYPGLEERVAAYHPMARAVVSFLVGVLGLLGLLEVWGLPAIGWLVNGSLGTRLLSAIVTVGTTLLTALVVWEGMNAGIQRHLARLAREAQLARSARLRTLLPMARTALLIAICVVVVLVVLSEIGVNIAPLLAGAGVVGLAIGFGSQKLVQDIITGLFLLLENTMQVGDSVSLGGLSGTVENLSIRTIRLRALDGAVHIIPFSAVTTVTNNTRDFGYAVLDIPVGLNEEPDRVIDVLRELARKMRTEPRWSDAIRDDLEIMGVEKFQPQSWILRARIKTTPSQRWAVGREFNRRIKYRFDELAIESPITSYRALHESTPPYPEATSEAAS
jgi:moderate conductance mechanosensitive channel